MKLETFHELSITIISYKVIGLNLSQRKIIYDYDLTKDDRKGKRITRQVIYLCTITLFLFFVVLPLVAGENPDIIFVPIYLINFAALWMALFYIRIGQSFTVYETGVHPPVRPLTELFNTNYFIPYNKIKKAKYEETHYKGTPYAVFEFWLYLTDGKIIKINTGKMPLSLLESKRKKEMLKVMKMFKIITEEINSKEFQEKRKKRKEINIGRELFEMILDE